MVVCHYRHLFALFAFASLPQRADAVIGRPAFVVHSTAGRTTAKSQYMLHHANDHEDCIVEKEPIVGIETRREWFERSLIRGGVVTAASTGLVIGDANSASAAAVSSPTADRIESDRVSSWLCDPTVSSWKKQGRVVHIVGTAHISSVSADLAGKVVREVQPNCVFVELDMKRIERAFRGGRPIPGTQIAFWDSIGTFRIGTAYPRERPPNPLGILGKLLGGKSSRLAEQEGFLAGEEFIKSVEEGSKIGAVVFLGDRDMNLSMSRLVEAGRKTDKRQFTKADKVMTDVMKQTVPETAQWGKKRGRASVDDVRSFIETMKTKETVDRLMGIYKDYVPDFYTALVKERDDYMAQGLDALKPFKNTVAVMGLAHVDGVTRNLEAKGWRRIQKRC